MPEAPGSWGNPAVAPPPTERRGAGSRDGKSAGGYPPRSRLAAASAMDPLPKSAITGS